MSIKVMSRVWADESLKSRAKILVMLAIADFSNDDGLAWPSIETLAKKSRCCQRSVQAIISELVKTDKLEVKYGEGPYGTNIYRITGGCNSCTPPASSSKLSAPLPPQVAVRQLHPIRKYPSSEPSLTPKPPGGISKNPIGESLHLERILKAKQSEADDLKNRFCAEVAGGDQIWSKPAAKLRFQELRRECREITKRIGAMA